MKNKFNLLADFSSINLIFFVVSAFFEAMNGFYIMILVNVFMVPVASLERIRVIFFFLGLTLINVIFKWKRKKCIIDHIWKKEEEIYIEIMRNMFSQDKYPPKMEKGKLQALLTSRIQNYQSFLLHNLENIIYLPFVFFFSFLGMIFINGKIGLLILGCVILCGFLNQFLTLKMPQASHAYYRSQDELFQFQKELAEQKETIVLSNMEKPALNKYQNMSEYTRKAENEWLKKHRDAYIPGLLNEYLPTFLLMVIFILNITDITPGEGLALMSLTGNVSLPLSQFFRSEAMLKKQEPFLESVKYSTMPCTFPVYQYCDTNIFEIEKGRFSYNDGNFKLYIPEFSFSSGEKVVITGASGAGKSTFIRLLLGLQKIDEGIIKSKYEDPQKNWNHGAYVDGENCAFDGSLVENITFKKELETYEQKQKLEYLITLLHLDDLSQSEYVLSALHLSGGQKQKIALARALFTDPDFLILDEPLAAVDQKSEKEIIQFLQKLPQAMVIISHRPEIWSICDRQYSIKGGILYEV